MYIPDGSKIFSKIQGSSSYKFSKEQQKNKSTIFISLTVFASTMKSESIVILRKIRFCLCK